MERYEKCWVWDFFPRQVWCSVFIRLFPSIFHSTSQKSIFPETGQRYCAEDTFRQDAPLCPQNCLLAYGLLKWRPSFDKSKLYIDLIHWYTWFTFCIILQKFESWGLHRSSLALEGSLFVAPLPQTFAGLLEAQSCWEAQIEWTPRWHPGIPVSDVKCKSWMPMFIEWHLQRCVFPLRKNSKIQHGYVLVGWNHSSW